MVSTRLTYKAEKGESDTHTHARTHSVTVNGIQGTDTHDLTEREKETERERERHTVSPSMVSKVKTCEAEKVAREGEREGESEGE